MNGFRAVIVIVAVHFSDACQSFIYSRRENSILYGNAARITRNSKVIEANVAKNQRNYLHFIMYNVLDKSAVISKRKVIGEREDQTKLKTEKVRRVNV